MTTMVDARALAGPIVTALHAEVAARQQGRRERAEAAAAASARMAASLAVLKDRRARDERRREHIGGQVAAIVRDRRAGESDAAPSTRSTGAGGSDAERTGGSVHDAAPLSAPERPVGAPSFVGRDGRRRWVADFQSEVNLRHWTQTLADLIERTPVESVMVQSGRLDGAGGEMRLHSDPAGRRHWCTITLDSRLRGGDADRAWAHEVGHLAYEVGQMRVSLGDLGRYLARSAERVETAEAFARMAELELTSRHDAATLTRWALSYVPSAPELRAARAVLHP